MLTVIESIVLTVIEPAATAGSVSIFGGFHDPFAVRTARSTLFQQLFQRTYDGSSQNQYGPVKISTVQSNIIISMGGSQQEHIFSTNLFPSLAETLR